MAEGTAVSYTHLCELVHDPQEHIFRLTGEGVAVERLNVTATKIILLIKIIYRDKILGEGLNETVTNLAEIREYGKNTNLINEKLTMAEWKDALYVMSKHQIIEVPGAIQNVEDQTKIYIYSTINLYCSGVDIQALMKEYVDEEGGAEVEMCIRDSKIAFRYSSKVFPGFVIVFCSTSCLEHSFNSAITVYVNIVQSTFC